MTAPILALDLDGVCNDDAFVRAALAGHGAIVRWDTDLAARTLDPVRVARVQRICDATGASIVLVTGWRRWASTDDIAACLRAAGLTAPVLDAVGGIKFSGADLRAQGLREWLDEHHEVTRWCVLDDLVTAWEASRNVERRELFRGRMTMVHTSERYVPAWLVGRCVHPRDGVTDDDAAACVAILGAAPSPRALAPCDDCRAPAGVACGPACPSRVEPSEAP